MTTRIFGSARYVAGVLVILAGSLPLIGCDDAYSSYVQYTLRTDPLVITDKFGDDQLDPDRPGIFPILSAKDVFNPLNPMSLKGKKLFPDVLIDPTLISNDRDVDGNRHEIKAKLDEWFGTPRDPRVNDAPSNLDLDHVKLAAGSRIYRLNCLHCHGVNGDGRGITARFFNPHPRDFRQGLFKFQSVDQVSTSAILPPRRDDLRRTIHEGVEGTAMPAFGMALQPKEIDAVVSYVIHLSIRGQVEYETIKSGAYEFDREKNTLEHPADEPPVGETMEKLKDIVVGKWVRSQTKPIKIRPYPFNEGVDNEEYKASVQRGYFYFTGNDEKQPGAKGLNCVSCHVNFGRQSMYKWDSWGTLAKPNNLTNGIYRGGRRTVDIYHRIHSGINGSNMPAFGVNENTPATANAVWDLVNFIQALPYPAMREKLGIVID